VKRWLFVRPLDEWVVVCFVLCSVELPCILFVGGKACGDFCTSAYVGRFLILIKSSVPLPDCSSLHFVHFHVHFRLQQANDEIINTTAITDSSTITITIALALDVSSSLESLST